jgi:DsbC/DsbD-like thiol-disulfide interchange protein
MRIVLFVSMWLAAQVPATPPLETAHLSLAVSSHADAAVSGRKVTLVLDVTPKPKMHVYAPGQDGYIPIRLTLTRDAAFTAATAKYPAGTKYVMPALNETQIVYASPFRITQEITIAPAAAGALHVKGSVRYQACDDAICYLPKTVPVEWTLEVR